MVEALLQAILVIRGEAPALAVAHVGLLAADGVQLVGDSWSGRRGAEIMTPA
jgi:hypothetical protein